MVVAIMVVVIMLMEEGAYLTALEDVALTMLETIITIEALIIMDQEQELLVQI
jgi:hypothetical protein